MTPSPHTPREGDVRATDQLSGERIGWADWEMKIGTTGQQIVSTITCHCVMDINRLSEVNLQRSGGTMITDTKTQQRPFHGPCRD